MDRKDGIYGKNLHELDLEAELLRALQAEIHRHTFDYIKSCTAYPIGVRPTSD